MQSLLKIKPKIFFKSFYNLRIQSFETEFLKFVRNIQFFEKFIYKQFKLLITFNCLKTK